MVAATVVLLFASACDGIRGDRTPASAYRNIEDRISVAVGLPYIGIAVPCLTEQAYDGEVIVGSIPTDQCFRMTEPTRWQGVWVNEFEGARFCPGKKLDCPYKEQPSLIWLDPARSVLDRERYGAEGGRYLIDFIGRRTLYAGNYGHMGAFDHEIIVDRMISIRRLEGPPGDAAKN